MRHVRAGGGYATHTNLHSRFLPVPIVVSRVGSGGCLVSSIIERLFAPNAFYPDSDYEVNRTWGISNVFAEEGSYSRSQMNQILDLAEKGIAELFIMQKQALSL